jgi:hypothetical protein
MMPLSTGLQAANALPPNSAFALPTAPPPTNHARGLQHHGRSAKTAAAVQGTGALPAALAGVLGGGGGGGGSGSGGGGAQPTISKERKQALFGGPPTALPGAAAPGAAAKFPVTQFLGASATPAMAPPPAFSGPPIAGESQRDRRLRERAEQRAQGGAQQPPPQFAARGDGEYSPEGGHVGAAAAALPKVSFFEALAAQHSSPSPGPGAGWGGGGGGGGKGGAASPAPDEAAEAARVAKWEAKRAKFLSAAGTGTDGAHSDRPSPVPPPNHTGTFSFLHFVFYYTFFCF